MARREPDGHGERMPARLDQAPIHAALDLQAAEGVGHLDRTPEALRQLRRETRHARRAAREADAAERLVGGGRTEDAERPRDLLDDDLRHRGGDRLGRAGIDTLGGPARLQRLRVVRREPELPYERVAVLGAAHRYVAGEGGAALFQDVDRRVARPDVDQPDRVPLGRVVVELEHVLEREVVDVDQHRLELGRADRLGVAVDDLLLHRDDQNLHLVAVLDPVDHLVVEVDVVERVRDQVARLGQDGGVDRRARLPRQDDLLHDHRRPRDGGDDLLGLGAGVSHQLADGLDHRALVLDDVRLDDGGRQRGQAERGETRPAGPLLHLGELDAARADVEDQEAALAAERVLELRAQDPLDERMTAQTICERQGILLLISPHPRLGLAARRPKTRKPSEKPRPTMRCRESDVKARSLKVPLPTSCTMQPMCPPGAVGLQKREDPVASSQTGSPRVQKGGAERRNCKSGATGRSAESRLPAGKRGAHAGPPCSFSVWRDEIVTHSHAMHRLVAIAPLPPVPRHDLLTYRIPEPLRERVRPGVRVRVPLGRQTRTGVVAAFADTLPPGELRSIVDVLDADPFLPADLLELCRWTARYYLASLAEVIATIVPASVPRPSEERALRLARRLSAEEATALARRAPARARAYHVLAAAPDTQLTSPAARAAGIGAAALRALVAAGLAEPIVRARATAAAPEDAPRPTLTPAQRTAADAIAQAVAGGGHASFLLHGITGSGKTEVFLAAAEATLAAGREVVLLVPEIAP